VAIPALMMRASVLPHEFKGFEIFLAAYRASRVAFLAMFSKFVKAVDAVEFFVANVALAHFGF